MTNWRIFYFCIRLISSTEKEVSQCKENFYAWETCPLPEKQSPHFKLPGFINKTLTLLVSPSFTYTKPGPGCQGHVTLFLTFHKQIRSVNISFLQTKGALNVPSKSQWEMWCICSLWPCQDPAKLQWPCQISAHGSQHMITLYLLPSLDIHQLFVRTNHWRLLEEVVMLQVFLVALAQEILWVLLILAKFLVLIKIN
jgi:hypothetical protein